MCIDKSNEKERNRNVNNKIDLKRKFFGCYQLRFMCNFIAKKMINISSIFYMKISLLRNWTLRLIYILKRDEFVYFSHYGRCLFSTISHLFWKYFRWKCIDKNRAQPSDLSLNKLIVNQTKITFWKLAEIYETSVRRYMKRIIYSSYNLFLEFVEMIWKK